MDGKKTQLFIIKLIQFCPTFLTDMLQNKSKLKKSNKFPTGDF